MTSERIHKYEESKGKLIEYLDFIQHYKTKNCFTSSYGSPFNQTKKPSMTKYDIIDTNHNHSNNDSRVHQLRKQCEQALEQLEHDYLQRKKQIWDDLQQRTYEEEQQMKYRIKQKIHH